MGKGAVVGFGVVMLAIGAVLGFALRPADRSAVAEVAGDSPSIGPAADLGESATIAALRERVKSLEAELASMRESSMRIRRLQEIERENLLATAVRNVGLSREDAEELVETIQDVYEATNSGRGGPDGPPPPPPPQEAR